MGERRETKEMRRRKRRIQFTEQGFENWSEGRSERAGSGFKNRAGMSVPLAESREDAQKQT